MGYASSRDRIAFQFYRLLARHLPAFPSDHIIPHTQPLLLMDYVKLHSDYLNSGAMAKLILESTFDALFTVTPDGIITSWNKGAQNIYGFAENEILGRSSDILVPDDEKAEYNDLMNNLRSGKKIDGIETKRMSKDGVTIDVVYSATPINDQGALIGMAISHRDISDFRKAEKKFTHIFESAPDAQLLIGSDGVIQLINEQCEKTFGYTKQELIGQKIETLVPEKFRKGHVEKRENFVATGKSRRMGSGHQLWGKKKDGTVFEVDILLNPLHMNGETIILAVVRDLSEIRKHADYARNLSDEEGNLKYYR